MFAFKMQSGVSAPETFPDNRKRRSGILSYRMSLQVIKQVRERVIGERTMVHQVSLHTSQ
jgi:hypothetical protein